MKIKLELLKKRIADLVIEQINDLEIDTEEIADTTAVVLVSKISDIIKNPDYSDFDVVEAVVRLFEEYKIDAGERHDF